VIRVNLPLQFNVETLGQFRPTIARGFVETNPPVWPRHRIHPNKVADRATAFACGLRVSGLSSGGFKTIPAWLSASSLVIASSRF
jgi:hypothetical protein